MGENIVYSCVGMRFRFTFYSQGLLW